MNKIEKKAFVASEDMTANLTLINYISASNNIEGFQMNVFSDMEEAKKWLIS
jgi:hypothetical protein